MGGKQVDMVRINSLKVKERRRKRRRIVTKGHSK